MNSTYLILFCLLIHGASFTALRAQVLSGSDASELLVVQRLDLISAKKSESKYLLTLHNNGPRAVYYCANPQDLRGKYGYYVSLDKEANSILDVQCRVFDSQITLGYAAYANKIRVELKKLEPGKTAQESIVLIWPLSETTPPHASGYSQRVEKRNARVLRFTFAYFEEDAGILEFLSRKPFGWFVKGNERLQVGTHANKTLYEQQRLLSLTVDAPK